MKPADCGEVYLAFLDPDGDLVLCSRRSHTHTVSWLADRQDAADHAQLVYDAICRHAVEHGVDAEFISAGVVGGTVGIADLSAAPEES